jgi:hypothetical protein
VVLERAGVRAGGLGQERQAVQLQTSVKPPF